METPKNKEYKKAGSYNYQINSRKSDMDKVLNKAPSERQITAEQILREAYEHRADETKQRVFKISTPGELADYQLRKRVGFEEKLRRQPYSINCWLRYARWEETQKEWDRARSIFERAIAVDYQNSTIWLKYTEFEMKNQFPNHARNVWDRAVQLLPRVEQFWYKYALMEERLGNFDKARSVFERWMKWDPPASAWESYVKLEMRCGGNKKGRIERAREIWKKFCKQKEELSTFLKWAKFEEKFGEIESAREAFTTALERMGEDAYVVKFFTEFAEFEKRAKEVERAKAIYKFAIDNVPKEDAKKLFEKYSSFGRQTGTRNEIDDIVLRRKRFEYEERLKEDPRNYDVWFGYLRMEEKTSGKTLKNDAAIDLFERSVAALPPAPEKRLWRRYIYLWIQYAFFLERKKEFARAREVYRQCLNLLPHEKFTFAKIWILSAKFELRRMDLKAARKLLGEAIGRAPKGKIFRAYIEIETKLLEMDRCRKLHEKFLEHAPENCEAWHNYAEMEGAIGENERARAIYELGVGQEVLDVPENLWTHYIDFEVSQKNVEKVKSLYERLLERTKNVKVWISYAETMLEMGETKDARNVYSRADVHFKAEGAAGGSFRNELLRSWIAMEKKLGEVERVKKLTKLLPRLIRRKRKEGEYLEAEGEFLEFVFPDAVDPRSAHLRLLSMAHKWKKAKKEG